MKLHRGDVVITRFPHASGFRGKKRPALVVQADTYNGTVAHLIVAQITSNLAPANDPAFVLIDLSTADGQASGLSQDSMVSGLFLATVFADQVELVIGKLSVALMQKVDACLKVALELQ
jgi:mRNA-degrading endonuclease toxin of MazEF toxin-antitoxin module